MSGHCLINQWCFPSSVAVSLEVLILLTLIYADLFTVTESHTHKDTGRFLELWVVWKRWLGSISCCWPVKYQWMLDGVCLCWFRWLLYILLQRKKDNQMPKFLFFSSSWWKPLFFNFLFTVAPLLLLLWFSEFSYFPCLCFLVIQIVTTRAVLY